jgi:hypothetical protein
MPQQGHGRITNIAEVRTRLRCPSAVLAAMLAVWAMAACTSTPSSDRASTPAQTPATTTGGRVIPTAPVVAGPTSTAAKDCPLVSQSVTQTTVGQRLDHATVQVSGGKVVGCEFFPITTGLAGNEHLPTGGYPSAKIVIATYQSAVSARQVLAITARAGGSPSLNNVDGLVAETFQSRFYPPDGHEDWFCAFIKGPLLVTVSVAENTSQGQDIALGLAARVAPKI